MTVMDTLVCMVVPGTAGCRVCCDSCMYAGGWGKSLTWLEMKSGCNCCRCLGKAPQDRDTWRGFDTEGIYQMWWDNDCQVFPLGVMVWGVSWEDI